MSGKYWIQSKPTSQYYKDEFGNRVEMCWADAVQLVNKYPVFEMKEVDDSYSYSFLTKSAKLKLRDSIYHNASGYSFLTKSAKLKRLFHQPP